MDTKLMITNEAQMFPLQTIKFLRVGCNKIWNGLPKGTGSGGSGTGTHMKLRWFWMGSCNMVLCSGSHSFLKMVTAACGICTPEPQRGTDRRRNRERKKKKKKSYKGRRHLRDCRGTQWDGRCDHISGYISLQWLFWILLWVTQFHFEQ